MYFSLLLLFILLQSVYFLCLLLKLLRIFCTKLITNLFIFIERRSLFCWIPEESSPSGSVLPCFGHPRCLCGPDTGRTPLSGRCHSPAVGIFGRTFESFGFQWNGLLAAGTGPIDLLRPLFLSRLELLLCEAKGAGASPGLMVVCGPQFRGPWPRSPWLQNSVISREAVSGNLSYTFSCTCSRTAPLLSFPRKESTLRANRKWLRWPTRCRT